MIIFLIIGVLLGVVAVFFVLQNVSIVTVSLFAWDFTGSLALVLALAIFSGALVVTLLLLPESIHSYFKYRSLKKEYDKLEQDLRKQKELTLFAKETPPTKEDIDKIEQGVITDVPAEEVL